jgi:hypothetical protein
MKTAIQKLISTFHLYQNSASTHEEQELLSFYIKCAEDLLEKEKEQIIDAYYGNIDGVYGYREAGEQYYNQTYNQNK